MRKQPPDHENDPGKDRPHRKPLPERTPEERAREREVTEDDIKGILGTVSPAMRELLTARPVDDEPREKKKS